jgi:hypothetical protein
MEAIFLKYSDMPQIIPQSRATVHEIIYEADYMVAPVASISPSCALPCRLDFSGQLIPKSRQLPVAELHTS